MKNAIQNSNFYLKKASPCKKPYFAATARNAALKRRIVFSKAFKLSFSLCCAFALLLVSLVSASCSKKQFDLFSCVSELRDNVLIAQLPLSTSDTEGFRGENLNKNNDSANTTPVKTDEVLSLTVYSFFREQPFLDDGVAGTIERMCAFYFSARDGSQTYDVSFEQPQETIQTKSEKTKSKSPAMEEKKETGGEMCYDEAKKEYYYICSLDLSQAERFPVTIKNVQTGKEYNFETKTVKTSATLTPRALLSAFENAENETLAPLKTENDFLGEIRIRLISSEGKTYYYLGIITENKENLSYLLDGETAKILAKRNAK